MLAKDYKIRVFIVLSVFFVFFSIILVRLFLIQINQKDFFRTLAQHQHEISITINPPRANIVDRMGKVIAFNRDIPSAFILPHQLKHGQKTEKFLKRHFPEVYERMQVYPEKYFLWIERKLSPQRYAQLKAFGMEDIQFINEPQRFYPYRSLAHLLGFTNIDNEGISGVELEFTKKMSGHAATLRLEKDARSGLSYFEKGVEVEGVDGEAVKLTIDSTLQALVYEELQRTIHDFNAKGGSALVLNPDNGEIIAMANYPGFDPNQTKIQALDITKNMIVTECFELGSVLKIFCALAGFEEGVVRYDEMIDCEGHITYIDGFKVENFTYALLNALKENNNILPFYDVIRLSSNVGVAKIAKRLGPKLYRHLRRVGFGFKTGIQFPGERAGFVNHPDNWSRSSIIVLSFGYEIMASLLQLGRAFSIIANGGHSVQPKIIMDATAKPIDIGRKLYKDTTIAQMKDLLELIGKKYAINGYRTMGKTGTARCLKNGHYSKTDHNYTFAGIVERDNYRRVIVTFIKEPEKANLWASEVAAPLFQSIAEKMVIHDTFVG